jgi:hypothetical protein
VARLSAASFLPGGAVAADGTPRLTVEEYELVPGGMPGGAWELLRGNIRLADSSNYFAPANLR